jgi:hypothetical protein
MVEVVLSSGHLVSVGLFTTDALGRVAQEVVGATETKR